MNRKLYKELAYYIGKMKGELRHVQDMIIVDRFINDIIKNVLSNRKDFDSNKFLKDIEDAKLKFESEKNTKCTIDIVFSGTSTIDTF